VDREAAAARPIFVVVSVNNNFDSLSAKVAVEALVMQNSSEFWNSP
jgi:hypothetical protein